MIKRIISCLLAGLILVLPIEVQAEELQGTVTSLAAGQEAPYNGILLDPIAAAKMLIDKKYLRIETELQLRKEFEKNLAEKTVAFNLLKVDFDSLKRIHDDTLLIKEKQISDLNLMLKEEMKPDHTQWWILGGTTIGIILSVAVFYASVEIAKQ
jgi:hypothetical protein